MSEDRQTGDRSVRSGATTTYEAGSSLVIEGTLDTSGATVASGSPIMGEYTQAISYTELGSGASDFIPVADFPTNAFVLAAWLEVDTAAAGEADLAATIGDTADDDGLMTTQNLNAVVAGTRLAADGARTGVRWEADAGGDGLGVTFTATELDDVTAGAWTLHVLYIPTALAS
jgi:hypothetical protein